MIEPEILTRRYWKKVFQVIAILIGLCIIVTSAYQHGYSNASAAHREEATLYAGVCRSIKNMGFDLFNEKMGEIALEKAGVKDIREIVLPDYDCQYVEKLAKYNPREK